MSNIYLDHNATTVLDNRVKRAMFELAEEPLNPSSSHLYGRKAASIIEKAREKISSLANAYNFRIVFTSSGTEANNLALRGLPGHTILTSAIEHPSVIKTSKECRGITVPATKDGAIDTKALEKLLTLQRGKILISVMLANNETGVIQPVSEVVKIAKKHNALVHADAAQCFGKMDIDIEDLGVDMLTISAHKFGGPQGAAALIVRKIAHLKAVISGGGQEYSLRAGTENVMAIHGFGVAADIIASIADEEKQARFNKMRTLRDRLEQEIKAFAPEVIIFGKGKERLPNTSYLSMPSVASETQLIHFDMQGIAVSAGSACSSGKIEVSHVLKNMGVGHDVAKTAVRVSLGVDNTNNDIDAFIDAWKQLYENVNMDKVA